MYFPYKQKQHAYVFAETSTRMTAVEERSPETQTKTDTPAPSTETEKQAARRASIIDKYNTELQRVSDNSQPTTETTQQNTQSLVSKVTTAINQPYSTVVDVKTKPPLPENAEENIKEHDEFQVQKVQFIFADDTESRWYEWDITNEQSPLYQILHYYADGNISQLFGTRVRCTGNATASPTYSQKQIETPTPFNKRSSHLRHSIYWKLEQLREIMQSFGSKNTSYTKKRMQYPGQTSQRYITGAAKSMATIIQIMGVLLFAFVFSKLYVGPQISLFLDILTTGFALMVSAAIALSISSLVVFGLDIITSDDVDVLATQSFNNAVKVLGYPVWKPLSLVHSKLQTLNTL